MHHDSAAVLGRIGDTTEVHLLVWSFVGLKFEVLQHRSKHDIHLGIGEGSADATAGSTAERHPRESGRPRADEAVRIKAVRVREEIGILRVGRRCSPRPCNRVEYAIRRVSKCGDATWRPAKSITVRFRCSSRMVACRNSLPPSSASFTNAATISGWRRSRSNAQPKVDAVVSCPAPSSVSSSSEMSWRDIELPSSYRLRSISARMSVRSSKLRVRLGVVDQRVTVRSKLRRNSANRPHGLWRP